VKLDMKDRSEEPHRDMRPEEFMAHAKQAVDWIANYLENMDRFSVLAKSKPGEIKRTLPDKPPERPEPFDKIFHDFETLILPGITHWNHPRFFGYFSVTGSYPGVIGELLASALNVNAMLWKTSPAATELEETVLDWLRQVVGLPEAFVGVINDTASVGSLCALAAAREWAKLDIRHKGLSGRTDIPALAMYASAESHSSIEKAAIVLGIGQEGLRKIPSDERYQMDIAALETAMKNDMAAGIKPICVIATLGTTSTTSVDPVKKIADLCRNYGVWLHVDAAYGGSAAVLPEKRHLFDGWELADSIIVNPHKWMFTPIDCSVLFCQRPETLKQAFSLTPEYLRTDEADETMNYMEYGVALGRRFRALKLWMILRTLGREGIADAIRSHIECAQRLKSELEAHPAFELLAPVPFSTLVFRFCPEASRGMNDDATLARINAMNETLLDRVNATGRVFLSHTKLKGQYGIRLAIGNLKTTWQDVALAWDIIQKEARQLQ